jgi:outer membrane protein TolC
MLRPVHSVFRSFTFGIEFDVPIRNRNQGAIAAAQLEREAAGRRADFGELTIRRDVAVALARYERAVRSMTIFQNGVRDQANANLQVVWQTYELGSRSLLDYIGEQRRFLEVENDLISAELEAYNAYVEILLATNDPKLITK